MKRDCGKSSFMTSLASGLFLLIIATFMGIVFLMIVMSISFALLFEINKSLWNQKMVSLQRFCSESY